MRVVSRGMMSPAIILVSLVVNNVVLRLHILALKVRPLLFHRPTSLLFQCTNLLPSLWLPCILFVVLLSGVMHALSTNILLQNYQLPR